MIGETFEAYYDDTNFYANNVAGGTGGITNTLTIEAVGVADEESE